MTRIFLAGHRGMVGGAILRRLEARRAAGEPLEIVTRRRAELDLGEQAAVRDFMQEVRPDVVILAAARVGGIHANNTYPADFIYENLMLQANVIHQAWAAGVGRLLQLGSSCIYPREAAQPMAEDALLTGVLEPTNEPYAVAKIAGIKLCESYNRQHGTDYRSVMPTNLYGPGDNFHPSNSHVLPALIRRFHEAVRDGRDEVVIWGTGTPRREFLHVDDMAEAALFVMDLSREDYAANTRPMLSHINIGSGSDISIADLARKVAEVTGFQGRLSFDRSKPDGTPRKLMDVSRLAAMGWSARIPLDRGLAETYAWFRSNEDRLRGGTPAAGGSPDAVIGTRPTVEAGTK
jgi:nucleoside-diphosphate-sugar epimerase